MNTQICFERDRFNAFVICIVIICGLTFTVYNEFYKDGSTEDMTNINLNQGLSNAELFERIRKSDSELNRCKIDFEYCKSDLAKKCAKTNRQKNENEIYSGSSPSRDYNMIDQYQQVGILYNDTIRAPLYGRQKYMGRSDRWEYYTIDDSRNSLRISVKSVNFKELYNGDTVTIPILSPNPLSVELYEYDNFRYLG